MPPHSHLSPGPQPNLRRYRRRFSRRRGKGLPVTCEAVVLGIVPDINPVGVGFDLGRPRRGSGRALARRHVGVGGEVEGAREPFDPLQVRMDQAYIFFVPRVTPRRGRSKAVLRVGAGGCDSKQKRAVAAYKRLALSTDGGVGVVPRTNSMRSINRLGRAELSVTNTKLMHTRNIYI